MTNDFIIKRKTAFLQRAHRGNASTGRIHLRAQLNVGWAEGQAQATVNTVKEFFVIDEVRHNTINFQRSVKQRIEKSEFRSQKFFIGGVHSEF
jgi:hypothetical protein